MYGFLLSVPLESELLTLNRSSKRYLKSLRMLTKESGKKFVVDHHSFFLFCFFPQASGL
jgi:hypothetical protein